MQEIWGAGGTVFVDAIIRADGHIVGYGIFEIAGQDAKWFALMEQPPHTRDFSRELGGKFLAICGCVWYNISMNKILLFSTEFPVAHGRGYVYFLQYHEEV